MRVGGRVLSDPGAAGQTSAPIPDVQGLALATRDLPFAATQIKAYGAGRADAGQAQTNDRLGEGKPGPIRKPSIAPRRIALGADAFKQFH